MNFENTLIIIPTYNESENLSQLFRRIRESVGAIDLLIVDDSSPDGTADLATELLRDSPGSSVLRREGLRGLGRSYVDGYLHALAQGFDKIVQMDADLSHDPSHIPDLL